MKKFSLILSLVVVLCSCKKEHTEIIVPLIGQEYNIKPDNYIFNKGAYRPADPVKVLDLYTGPNGTPFAHCSAPIDWASFALKSGNGVAQQTVLGNIATMADLNAIGIYFGDQTVQIWQVPQYDLTQVN